MYWLDDSHLSTGRDLTGEDEAYERDMARRRAADFEFEIWCRRCGQIVYRDGWLVVTTEIEALEFIREHECEEDDGE